MSFEPGTVIAGKYRVERVIGRGGMGVVLAARHLGLDEMVAVKLIREERAAGPEAIARFQREARAAARIKNEHVARVLDVDRLPEGEPYIVMEFIDGTDLDALLERRGPLPPDEAATYVTQACEGLAEAHALGMVHRDLKLKNLFLTQRRDGRPLIKVIDFGVVKLARTTDDVDPTLAATGQHHDGVLAHDGTLTGTAMMVGSVHYMAPEQIRASNVVDARADVWSLGVCLHVLLTGELPFRAEHVIGVCAAIQGRPAPDPRERAPHVPAGLAAVVARALEKDVRRRYASVADLASALAPFGADPSAVERIENVLSSGVRPEIAATAAPLGVVARAADDSTATSNLSPKGRVESTIDGRPGGGHLRDGRPIAAPAFETSFGEVAPPRAEGRPTSRRLFAGLGLALVVAVTTVALWARRPPVVSVSPANGGAEPAEGAPIMTSPALPATALPPAPAVLPTVPPPSTAGFPGPSATTPAPPAVPLATRAPSRRGGKPPKTPAAAPSPLPAPKTEPSNAYDHF